MLMCLLAFHKSVITNSGNFLLLKQNMANAAQMSTTLSQLYASKTTMSSQTINILSSDAIAENSMAENTIPEHQKRYL